jgi:hypothetical protein
MVVEQDAKYYKDAISRITENIKICNENFKDFDLVQVYVRLRMLYIKKLASFYNYGETPTFVEYSMLKKVLNETQLITRTELVAFGLEVYTEYQFTSDDLARIYNYTGREFQIEAVNRIKFKINR